MVMTGKHMVIFHRREKNHPGRDEVTQFSLNYTSITCTASKADLMWFCLEFWD